jgi:hypothetical protein
MGNSVLKSVILGWQGMVQQSAENGDGRVAIAQGSRLGDRVDAADPSLKTMVNPAGTQAWDISAARRRPVTSGSRASIDELYYSSSIVSYLYSILIVYINSFFGGSVHESDHQ